MSEGGSSSTVLLARQPIFDRKLQVHAYELLYRGRSSTEAGEVGARESAATIVRAISEIGLEKLVGTKKAYINVPDFLFTEPALLLLPPDRVVLEILEHTLPTRRNLDAVQQLAGKGYKFALDDFEYDSPQAEFLPFVKIVKVDLLQTKALKLEKAVQQLTKTKVKLVAEKVENMESFNKCQALGFHYFQGYFCAKPELVTGNTIPNSLANLITLLNRLQDASVTLNELDQMISVDVGLTYRLLRMVNSVVVNPADEVDSVRTALLILGLERVRALVSLLALAAIEAKPSELMVAALVRAKMCESIAGVKGLGDTSRHFMVGLLSVLDAMLEMPMSDILKQIPLSGQMKEVLLNSEGISSPLGESLSVAKAFEVGDWDQIGKAAEATPQISRCYLAAVQWADKAAASIAA
jgi:EAL and modified HD-GYP domain-containing signal transduction protein